MEQNHPIPEEDGMTQSLPENLEAEQAILGAILLEQSSSMERVMSANIKPYVFSHNGHRKIFSSMLELEHEQSPIDVVTLMSKLSEKGWTAISGGPTYITRLAGSVPTAANIEHYINLVVEKYTQRELIEEAKRMSESARSDDPEKVIESARAKLDQLSDQTIKKGFRSVADISRDYYYDLEDRYNSRDGTGVTGMPSGYQDLDRLTAGFQKSDLIIIAARPSVGKTAFALNIARNAAVEKNETVAVFSLEMSEKQLLGRMISAEGNIDGSTLRSAHLLGDDWERVAMAISNIADYPIWIDDTPAITINEIRAKSRKIKADKGLGMIVIDYLQLIEVSNKSGASRQQEVSEISRTLKQIAKELDVPVVALSQLSRAVESRQEKRPMMSDLRESGSIEQDADIVAFLYRDDYYNQDTEKKNIIEIIIAKQRNGPVGTVELVFMKQFNKFANYDRSHEAYKGA